MVASQVIANRETGVTSHVLSFFGPAIQNVRFGLIFRVVWRKGYVTARPAVSGALEPIFTFCCLGRTFASLIYFKLWDRPIVTLNMHAH